MNKWIIGGRSQISHWATGKIQEKGGVGIGYNEQCGTKLVSGTSLWSHA